MEVTHFRMIPAYCLVERWGLACKRLGQRNSDPAIRSGMRSNSSLIDIAIWWLDRNSLKAAYSAWATALDRAVRASFGCFVTLLMRLRATHECWCLATRSAGKASSSCNAARFRLILGLFWWPGWRGVPHEQAGRQGRGGHRVVRQHIDKRNPVRHL